MLWLGVTPATGTLAPDGLQSLTVSVDATGLDPGTYSAQVVVRTNDPLNRILKTAVTLVVAG